MNPKPCILLAVSSLAAGGAERVIAELANAWAEQGWRVGVLTISNRESDHYSLHPAITRIALDLLWAAHSPWQSIAANVRRSRAIRQAARTFGPDVVVSFIDQTNIRMLAALLGSGIPVIVSERVDPRQHDIGKGWALARRLLYRFADAVVVQTDAVAGWAQDLLPARKAHVIPNFVPVLPSAAALATRENNEILAVGRLVRQKGFDLLLRAFASANLMAHGQRLIILGEGPERTRLENLARELGIAEAVSMPGIVKDVERWLARCTLFVLPSRFEGFPNALLEAMAMGCAVVAADCPSGPAELVTTGENGLLVPPEDIGALARALGKLIEGDELRARLGIRARAVRERYGRDAILGDWETLILHTIGES